MAGDSLNDIAEARKRVEQYEDIFLACAAVLDL
jgi:hypothetical protein